MSIEGYLGDNDEIYLPNSIKEALNLHPHQKILMEVIKGKLIISPSHILEEILNRPKKVKITLEEVRHNREQLSQDLES